MSGSTDSKRLVGPTEAPQGRLSRTSEEAKGGCRRPSGPQVGPLEVSETGGREVNSFSFCRVQTRWRGLGETEVRRLFDGSGVFRARERSLGEGCGFTVGLCCESCVDSRASVLYTPFPVSYSSATVSVGAE